MRNFKLIDYIVILRLQSVYFLATGIWPLISMSTFLKITGPKNDLWLVKVVGVLIGVIGMVLLTASFNKKRNNPVILLAISSSIALASIDVIFYLSKTIPTIYLLDAVIECVIIILWAWNINKQQK
ncbi:putative membrane protein [Algoriphagus sp. 4150]|uniref:hypothetical protein n=1 Tax=Algoriphagus sp. 4150 TaxID=2817756 RepID=UPI00285E8EA8|nr:hypothetical protein [Algoriphagus sp. 4150]MDR7127850.1 putative membrane protein [Algoriphagus sp. 4150]